MSAAAEILGSYKLLRELGRGGMGEVYLAEHTVLGKRVAVKVLRADRGVSADLARRFFNEARAAASLDHPGLVDVFDFGTDESGRSFIVMEYLDGESLGARLERGPIDHGLALDLARQAASAVAAAHGKQIVHRDLKPDNLYLVPDEAIPCGLRVKVLDFGIAKLGRTAPDVEAVAQTESGTVMGTPRYMSPEQCRGAGGVGPRTDVYALGVILYEMICGRPPFPGGGPGEVIASHLREPPPTPRSIAPSLALETESLILEMLIKDPAARPSMETVIARLDERMGVKRSPSERIASDDALAETIDSSRSVPAAATPPPADASRAPASPARSHRTPLVAVGGAVVAAAAVLAIWMATRGRAPSIDPGTLPAGQLAERCKVDPRACTRLGRLHERGIGVARSFVKAFDHYRRACDRGEMDACAHLGGLYLLGNGVRSDPKRAVALLRRACDGGSAIGCNDLADLAGVGRGTPYDPAVGAALSRRACDQGLAMGCLDLGRKLHAGLGIARDEQEADRRFRRVVELGGPQCEAGDDDACRALGLLYYRGYGVTVDHGRAVSLLERACEAGNPHACADVGQIWLMGMGVTTDRERGIEILRKGCEGGSPNACIALGSVYAQGIGVERDDAKAREIFEDACRNRGELHCFSLAVLYDQGRGVPKDEARANSLYARACDDGSSFACGVLAARYRFGVALDKDEKRAEELYARSCDLGNEVACADLGGLRAARGDLAGAFDAYDRGCAVTEGVSACARLAEAYLEGQGVAADVEKGLAIYRVSCEENNDGGACFGLGKRYRDGRGVTRDVARAIDLFETACHVGFSKACVAAARLLDGEGGVAADPARAAALRKQACDSDPSTCPRPEDAAKPAIDAGGRR